MTRILMESIVLKNVHQQPHQLMAKVLIRRAIEEGAPAYNVKHSVLVLGSGGVQYLWCPGGSLQR